MRQLQGKEMARLRWEYAGRSPAFKDFFEQGFSEWAITEPPPYRYTRFPGDAKDE